MTDLTTADYATLHASLVRDWLNYGPDEVYDTVDCLSQEELVNLVMLYLGKSALKQ